jgi:hypothetical protein
VEDISRLAAASVTKEMTVGKGLPLRQTWMKVRKGMGALQSELQNNPQLH